MTTTSAIAVVFCLFIIAGAIFFRMAIKAADRVFDADENQDFPEFESVEKEETVIATDGVPS